MSLEVNRQSLAQNPVPTVAALPLGTLDCQALNPRMFIRNGNGSDGAQVTEVTQTVAHNLYVDLVDSGGNYLGTSVPVAGRLEVTNGMGSEVFDNNDAAPTNKYIYTPPSSGAGNIDFSIGANDVSGDLITCNFSFPINIAVSPLRAILSNHLVIPPNDIARGSFNAADWETVFGKPALSPSGLQHIEVADFNGTRALNFHMDPVLGQGEGSTRSVAFREFTNKPKKARIAQRMRFTGTLTPTQNNKHTAKSGFGFRTQAASTGGNHNPQGFSVRPAVRGHGNGVPGMEMYTYIDSSPADGFSFGESLLLLEDDGTTLWTVPLGVWFDLVIEVNTNATAATSDGYLRAYVDGVMRYERNNMKYFSAGAGVIDWIVDANFWGGPDETWRPNGPCQLQVHDVCWETDF